MASFPPRIEAHQASNQHRQEKLPANSLDDLRAKIREIPDFPKPGILFYDITTLLKDPEAYRESIKLMLDPYRGDQLDIVALGPIAHVRDRLRLLQFQFSKFRLGPSYVDAFAAQLRYLQRAGYTTVTLDDLSGGRRQNLRDVRDDVDRGQHPGMSPAAHRLVTVFAVCLQFQTGTGEPVPGEIRDPTHDDRADHRCDPAANQEAGALLL